MVETASGPLADPSGGSPVFKFQIFKCPVQPFCIQLRARHSGSQCGTASSQILSKSGTEVWAVAVDSEYVAYPLADHMPLPW